MLLLLVIAAVVPVPNERGRQVYLYLRRPQGRHRVPDRLVTVNPVLAKDLDRLRVGQELKVCGAKWGLQRGTATCGTGGRLIVHTVKGRDTVGAIAARYSVSRDSIRSHNRKIARRSSS